MKYSAKKLGDMGFKLAMYSTAAVLAVQRALHNVYSTIYEHGHTEPMRDNMSTFVEFRELLDEELWTDLDKSKKPIPCDLSNQFSELTLALSSPETKGGTDEVEDQHIQSECTSPASPLSPRSRSRLHV